MTSICITQLAWLVWDVGADVRAVCVSCDEMTLEGMERTRRAESPYVLQSHVFVFLRLANCWAQI